MKLGDDEGEEKRGVARGDGQTLVISVLKGNVSPCCLQVVRFNRPWIGHVTLDV